MGIDLTANLNYGTAVVNFNNANPFTAYGRALVTGNAIDGLVRRAPRRSRPRCARWKAPAWCERWLSRT